MRVACKSKLVRVLPPFVVRPAFLILPSSTAWVSENNSGYDQMKFSILCSGCKFYVTNETLGLRRFVDDVNRPRFQAATDKNQPGYTELSNEEALTAMACVFFSFLLLIIPGSWYLFLPRF